MNWFNYLSLPLILALFSTSCTKDKIIPADELTCNHNFSDSSVTHPKAAIYQNILDQQQKDGLVGAVLLVKDRNGLWVGASGQADIASNLSMKPCNTFLIASISKVFTAAAVFRYIDKGLLSIDDKISKWLPAKVVQKVANADQATIAHLLSHRSGIKDYYTDIFELDRMNREYNNWTKEEVLSYIYGKPADFEVGTTYGYCNTNYLLLAMILEKASGLDFTTIYQQEVFNPLQLSSAYYSEKQVIPEGCVTGYADVNGDGELVAAQNLYRDELGIGGDGGIAINAYDLAVFLEQLMKDQLISQNSLSKMTDWFDLPAGWHWESYGQTENGFGLEKFNTDYGYAVGHTGGIDGFNSYGFYFPEEDMTYVLLVNNTKAFNNAKNKIFEQTLEEMFR